MPMLNTTNTSMGLSLTMALSYDIQKQRWALPSKGFDLKILSFKGPYGINRSVVGAILSLVTPMIRTQIVANLPHELGVLLYSLPAPFTLKGEFDVLGMDMAVLSAEFHKCPVFQRLSGLSSKQLHMCMERATPILTLSDFIAYRRKYEVVPLLWEQMQRQWAEACDHYSSHLVSTKMQQLMNAGAGNINPLDLQLDFPTLLTALDDILSKRTHLTLKLHHIDGQVSVNELVRFIYQVQHRLASDALLKLPAGLKKIRLGNFLDSLQKQYADLQDMFALVVQNFDFAHLTIV
ncbi:hypothetical protein B484DRAFT_403590, partial [Ochromonadaceae sp. CCMP2298]